MTQYYAAYVFRGDDEIEISAKLHDHGKIEEGYDRLGGHWHEIIDDPEFVEYTAFDDYGVELTLTPREIMDSTEQMAKAYWRDYFDGLHSEYYYG